jgi:RNA polymerase sigma-70 factor (ECF subfamily)
MLPGGFQAGGRISGARVFNTTHWSVVLSAGQAGSPESAEALERLCRTYWFPLYSFVRRQGHGPEEAQDLTQEFFAHFLEKGYVGRASSQRGKFRTFLLTSLQNFLRHEWERAQAQKRGGGRKPIPWDEADAESRYRVEVNPQLAPDQIFDQRWAMAVFQNALSQLQKESAAAGKGAQFDELKGFLSTEAEEGGYGAAAGRLGLTKGAVAVAVHRLRQRYGELVKEEIAHTVGSPAEAEEEMRYLIKLMSA